MTAGPGLEGPRLLAVSLVAAVALVLPAAAAGQEDCPAAAAGSVETGWAAYQDGRIDDAREAFAAALDRCPSHPGALTGAGYVLLRGGDDAGARARFLEAVEAQETNVDALVGLGLVAWRLGELEEVARRFTRVRELDPDNPTAADYLGRLPEGLGAPPDRPALVLPDTVELVARAADGAFHVRTDDGSWEEIWVKGMNLGAALPGRHPSQFPDSATYAGWMADMAEMGVNAVRVYTIHPPDFYEALQAWNETHPEDPLWLIHGVWTELPEDHDYLAEDFESEFFAEMRRVVDLLHGRADIPPRPGHASGFYTADVSDRVLAYVIGREWEPFSVLAFDSIHPGLDAFEGEYLTVRGGNAMDAWLAKAVEEMVAYETETYREQRPVAYTNWPTLDPLEHPTEATRDQEVAIREALGETVDVRPREYDNDVIGLDATLAEPTGRFPAGTFASFHAYPYYPDFTVYGRQHRDARSSLGPSPYFGYLTDLKAHHGDMPVLIAEYGVPASLGTGHLQPQGWHHGGLTEAGMASIDRRLTLELAEAGMAGGALFAWIDEWFKKNWVVIDFEISLDRNKNWYNRLDAEQHYGMVALEPEPALPGDALRDRLPAWREVEPLYETDDGTTLRATWDEAYLWLLAETPGRAAGDELLVGFDMIDPAAGDRRWPGAEGPELPVGVEFVLRDDGRAPRLLVDPPQNPFRIVPVGRGGRPPADVDTVDFADPMPGLFRDRAEMRFNLPYYTEPNADGRYDSLRVIVNRRRLTPDTVEFPAVGYDRGLLPGGPAPDGFWERSDDGSVLEVRIPWMLLNLTDPSSRRLLQGPGENVASAVRGPAGRWTLRRGVEAWPDSLLGQLGTEPIPDVGVVAALRSADGAWRSLPEGASEADGSVARFSWPTWEEPVWRARRRPVFDTLAATFGALGPEHRGRPAATLVEEPEDPQEPEGADAGAPDPDPPSADTVQEFPSPEAADEAWREGRTAEAVAMYERRLAADSTEGVALHRVALHRAWNERYEESLALFDRLLELQPGNLDARIDRAQVLAWRGDVSEALDVLAAILDEYPDHPRALETRARFQAWAGRFEESLGTYDRLLGITPGQESALRGRAQVLTWSEEFEASRAVYDSLLARNPEDVEARLGLAQVLSFADRLDAAASEYREVLRRDSAEVRGWHGLGRALSWGGELVAGEEVFRRGLERSPRSVGLLVGLGQNLRWQGRNAAALEVLERAAEVAPGHGDVEEQLDQVRVALGPRVQPSFVIEDDSDGNRMTTTSLTAAYHPLPRLGLRVDAFSRGLEQGNLEREALGFTLAADYQLEPGWTVAAGVGRTETDGEGEEELAAWRASVASPGRYPASGTVVVSQTPLAATARLAQVGVTMRGLELDGRWTPAPLWRVDAALGRQTFRGTEDNVRWNASASASRRLGRGFTVGLGWRSFGFEKDLVDGYFDPDFYGIAELTARWLWEPERWSLLLEGAPGAQQVGGDGDPAGTVRGNARLAYSVGPGREVSVAVGYSSAGLQSFSTGDSDYRYTAVIVGARWVF